MKSLFIAVLVAACALLSGCGTINPTIAAFENKAATDYLGAKANIQQADDMKLRAWLDGSCAINIGALQRAISTSGNPSIANAIFTACPVPAVGVTSTSATGSMQVQTFNLPPIVRDTTSAGSNSVPLALPPASPVSTPAVTATPITANTSALQTYTPPKKATRSRSQSPAPSTVAPSASPQPALTPAPAPSGFGTLAPNPNFPTTPAPSSQSPSSLPGGLPGQ